MKYDYFISYCATEKSLAHYILFNLSSIGFNVWLDNKEIQLSSNIKESILYGIQNSDYVISIISPKYLESEWTLYELNLTLSREKMEKRDILISFLFKYNLEQPTKVFPEIGEKSFHKIEKDISENQDLWMAKIINQYFVKIDKNIIEKFYNTKNQTDDFKILFTLYNQCIENINLNNIYVINLYNFSSYALYICTKNKYIITKNRVCETFSVK